MAEIENIPTTRGGVKLRFSGFIYRKKRCSANAIEWKCEVDCCKGKLRTNLNHEEPFERDNHCHDAPDEDVVMA